MCQTVIPSVKKNEAEQEDKDCGGSIGTANGVAGEGRLQTGIINI